jgi:hypothetical protein
MENEGIMGLPEGQAMQDQGAPAQPIYVSSADSYDAALTALGASTNDPNQAAAVKEAIRESIDELDLSPSETSALLEVLEYMSQNPDEYVSMRQRLIDSGIMDDDDLPEAYDPTYLGVAVLALNEYQAMGAEGAQAPMEMAPAVEGLEPMAMAEGGLADMAKYLASQGRNGDSILAHITPSEARLLKSMGGSGTINPQTGLPEFFLKKLFKGVKKAVKKILKNPIVRIIATVALATVLGPAAAGVIGAATGATAAGVALSTAGAAAATALASTAASAGVSALAGEKINAKNLLINAATSYFGAGGTIGGVNPVSSVAKLAGRLPGVTEGGKVAQGIGAGLTSAAVGKAAGMGTQEALGMGLQSGIMAGMAYDPLQEVQVTGKRVPTAEAAPAPGTAAQGPVVQGTAAQGPAADTGGAAFSNFDPNRVGDGFGAPAGTRYDVTTGRYVPTAPASAPDSTVFGRMGDYVKSLAPGGEKPTFEAFKNAFLVNPNADTKLGKYAPGVATALAVSGLTGGFKKGETEEEPLFPKNYTGEDYMRDNPELFKGRIAPTTAFKPYDPVVPTPSYGTQAGPSAPGQPPIPYTAPVMPLSPTPNYVPPPGSPTNMPGGIPQPYNVSGMYNVPLMYGNPARPAVPPGYAKGGSVMDQQLRTATNDPRTVAQTEAMLFAGPRAAQQAGMAMDALERQGIMGVPGYKRGGQPKKFPRKTGPINGPGTGTSDSIPAMLSDGEFVFTARAVRNAGNGSRRKGARRMYKLMKMLEGGKVEGK